MLKGKWIRRNRIESVGYVMIETKRLIILESNVAKGI